MHSFWGYLHLKTSSGWQEPHGIQQVWSTATEKGRVLGQLSWKKHSKGICGSRWMPRWTQDRSAFCHFLPELGEVMSAGWGGEWPFPIIQGWGGHTWSTLLRSGLVEDLERIWLRVTKTMKRQVHLFYREKLRDETAHPGKEKAWRFSLLCGIFEWRCKEEGARLFSVTQWQDQR